MKERFGSYIDIEKPSLVDNLPFLTIITRPKRHCHSIFQINGAQDDVIPIEGGERFGHSFFSAYESAQKWAGLLMVDKSGGQIY